MSVPGGASTLSKYPALFPANAPRALVRARGSRVWAEGGKEYTDWVSGLLTVTLGHAHPVVVDAVKKHCREGGPSWSLPHPLEHRVAEQLAQLVLPNGSLRVRWLKTGSEACAAAVRVARAVTGRDLVLSIGYHGWHDPLLTSPPAWGVPWPVHKLVWSLPFNDAEAVERAFFGLDPDPYGRLNAEDPSIDGKRIAAVILEPETLEEPRRGYLPHLRYLCDRYDSLLIFDECITGGRYPQFCASRHYGVEPDLWVFSKCLANGYPLAALVGSDESMGCFEVGWRPEGYGADMPAGPVYVSGTYAGETVSLAAAGATLRVWEQEKAAQRMRWSGRNLRESLDEVRPGFLRGPDYRLVLQAESPEETTYLRQCLMDDGILTGAGFNPTLSHYRADLEHTQDAWASAIAGLDALREAGGVTREHLLDGHVCLPPYRQA